MPQRIIQLVAVLILLGNLSVAPATAAAPLLPDLAMAPLRDIQLNITPDGRRLLRFTAEIINIGSGPFELHAERPSLSEPLMTTVRQRVFDTAGGWQEILTSASMHFAGDGHSHWHVNNLEEYTLIALDSPASLGVGAKSGFCFFDNHQWPGTFTPRTYISCGREQDLSLTMGLSVGWGDIYAWDLPDQYIDVSGIPPGRYRLTAQADPDHWFIEQDATNNVISIDLYIAEQQAFALSWHTYLSQIVAAPTP